MKQLREVKKLWRFSLIFCSLFHCKGESKIMPIWVFLLWSISRDVTAVKLERKDKTVK